MASDYWSRLLGNRIGRRRVLAATGATALGAAFLEACGGSDSGSNGSGNGGSQGGNSSAVAKAEDTTKQAKRGGIIKDRNTADPPTYDVQQAIAPLNFP